jgi:hypothetical protein
MWCPNKIEADFRQYYPGADIGQWHRGEMSSREFLVLLDELPDSSRYKGALRGAPFGLPYEWSPSEYREAALVRQLAPLNPDGDMRVTFPLYHAYFSPLERWIVETKQKAEKENKSGARSVIHAGLYAKVPSGRRGKYDQSPESP